MAGGDARRPGGAPPGRRPSSRASRRRAGPKALNALGTLARHPELTKAFNTFNGYILFSSTLTPRQRELLVLRVAALRRSAYEWEQHRRARRRRGTRRPDEVARIAEGPDAPGWSPLDRAMLSAVDELIGEGEIADGTWQLLAGELDEQQIMDLVFTVGAYEILALAFRSFGIELDDDLRAEMIFSYLKIYDIVSSSVSTSEPGGRHGALREARRGQLDRALPGARHRAGVLRGLDLAGALRARAQGDLRPDLAERRPGRAAAARRAATSPRRSTPPAPRSSSCAGKDGEVRAFHNICRHRGNKLVWNDYPGEETSGTCRQFTCKYHGWRYSSEGELTFVQQESEFFDLDKEDYGLAAVQVETWEGFIFVNLDPENTTSLQDYLGEFGTGLAGYPFDEMTQVYKYRAEVGSNWKLFIDAFAEFYHAPILHAKQATAEESRKLSGYRLRGAGLRASTGRTAWCRRGAACPRPRTSTWSSRSSGCSTAGCSARGTVPTSRASTRSRRA